MGEDGETKVRGGYEKPLQDSSRITFARILFYFAGMAQNISVPAGETACWPLRITAPSRVSWSFRVSQHHIEFYLAARRMSSDGANVAQEALTKKMWCAADRGEHRGEMTFRKPEEMGLALVFVWDNTHSYIRAKDVTFRITVEDVDPTETAASVEATSARDEAAAADALVQSLLASDRCTPGVFAASTTSDLLVQSLVESTRSTKSSHAIEEERKKAAAEAANLHAQHTKRSSDLEAQFAQWGF